MEQAQQLEFSMRFCDFNFESLNYLVGEVSMVEFQVQIPPKFLGDWD